MVVRIGLAGQSGRLVRDDDGVAVGECGEIGGREVGMDEHHDPVAGVEHGLQADDVDESGASVLGGGGVEDVGETAVFRLRGFKVLIRGGFGRRGDGMG